MKNIILERITAECGLHQPIRERKTGKTNIPVTEDRRFGMLKKIFASHLK